MTSILLVGAGEVGVRAARQLLDTPGVERVLVTDRRSERAEEVVRALGSRAALHRDPAAVPDEAAAVVVAVPAPEAVEIARACVASGRSAAVVADDETTIAGLLALDAAAAAAGAVVAVGCGLVPGLSDVLARHAADDLDRTDEIHVARFGAAGPACVEGLERLRRSPALEWHDDEWHQDAGNRGAQLVWFPEPVGARECAVAASGVTLLRDTVPEAAHASVRVGDVPEHPGWIARLAGRGAPPGWGAARVEVWGWRRSSRDVVVYGVVDRPAAAVGTVLGVTGARLAGLIPELVLRDGAPGARGLGTLVEPVPFLAELARRGVTAAVFEGVAA